MPPYQDNTVTIQEARIVFKNFAGKEGQYNREGDRNFAVLLDDDVAEAMAKDGWNVKYLKPREVEEEGVDEHAQAYIGVSISYKGRPPQITMISSRGRTNLGVDEIEMLDWTRFLTADVKINPYTWEVNGRGGVKAYLNKLFVTIEEDELDLKYADIEDAQSPNPHHGE